MENVEVRRNEHKGPLEGLLLLLSTMSKHSLESCMESCMASTCSCSSSADSSGFPQHQPAVRGCVLHDDIYPHLQELSLRSRDGCHPG